MSLATVVQTLTEIASMIEDEYDAAEEATPDQRAIIIAAARQCRAELDAFAKRVERELIETAPKRFTVEGLGEVEIRHRTKRTGWRHDELIPAVIARVMDEPETIFDKETGELLPYVTIGHNVARRLRECVSFGAGKVTGLRSLGLQVDEFCVEQEDGYSVQMPKAELPKAEVA